MRQNLFTLIFLMISTFSFGQQTDTTNSVFNRLGREMASFKMNTTDPPRDKKTSLINELRNLKGGFNINEAIQFKMEEDRNKGDLTNEEYKAVHTFFTTGDGRRNLDNGITWIYRNAFSIKELKQIVRFYKTQVGKKYAEVFPLIMLKSMAAGQKVKDEMSSKK